MMEKLLMTRMECANQIYRVASELRYNIDSVIEAAESHERDTELSYEINARQNIQTLVQLLQVMDDLS